MSNNINNDMKFEKGQKVKLVDGSSGEVYKIITLFPDRTIQLGEQDVSIQLISGSLTTRTVKRKQLRRLTDAEKKEQQIISRSEQPRRDRINKAPSLPADIAQQPSNEAVADQREDAPLSNAEKLTETESISTAPPSDVTAQNSENDLTPLTEDAVNLAQMGLPVPSSTLELKDVERVINEAFGRRDEEMKAIPTLHSFVLKIIGSLAGKSASTPNTTGTSTKDLRTALHQLEYEAKKLQSDAQKKDSQIKALEGERNSARDEASELARELKTEQETNRQLQSNLANEKSQNETAKAYWETEKGKLNESIQSETTRADKAEAESNERQTKLEASEQTLKDALNAFWKGRQEFYGGLHRIIIDLNQEEDRRRRQSSIDTRFDALQADIALLTSLHCQVTLSTEALHFKRCRFSSYDHEAFSDDGNIQDDAEATVLLPGWTYGEQVIKVKPILGCQEINS